MPPSKPFKIKQNATKPPLRVTLKDSDGLPADVTGASVVFSMRVQPTGTTKVDKQSVTVNDASAGDLQYDWTATNTNTADVYEGEFQVTYADSSVQTFPNDGYILIDVKDDVE